MKGFAVFARRIVNKVEPCARAIRATLFVVPCQDTGVMNRPANSRFDLLLDMNTIGPQDPWTSGNNPRAVRSTMKGGSFRVRLSVRARGIAFVVKLLCPSCWIIARYT